MPPVRPFRGLRYADQRPESLARAFAPPFDMIAGGSQRALLAASEHNIAWLTVADDGPGYPGVGERLAQWKRAGVVLADPGPAFYVYDQACGPSRLRAFLAAVRLDNPPETAVYPHENIFAEPIMDRLSLMKATRCALEPVFGLYTDETGRAAEVLGAAASDAPLWVAQTGEGATHRLWRLTDAARQQALRDVLAPARVVIADGHHRWAAARAYREGRRAEGDRDPEAPHEYGLMLLVEEKTGGVECGAFHRVIHRLPPGVSPTRLAQHLGPHFALEEFPTQGLSDEAAAQAMVERIGRRSGRHLFGARWQGGAAIVRIDNLEALLSTASRAIDPLIRDFDVALLHRLILRPRLGCHGDYGPQASAVLYEKDPVAAWRKVTSGSAVMAWFVNPAPTSAVMRAAFAGLKVPQKATHFHPKPPSGMVMYELA